MASYTWIIGVHWGSLVLGEAGGGGGVLALFPFHAQRWESRRAVMNHM